MITYNPRITNLAIKSCPYCKLAPICLPKDCTPSEITELAALVEHQRELNPGGKIYKNGQNLYYLHVLQSGSVKEIKITPNGSEKVLNFYLPGELMGLESICKGKHSFDAIALERSRICLISCEKLLNLSVKIPRLMYQIIHLMSKNIFIMQTFIAHQHSGEQRLASFLLSIAIRHKIKGSPVTDYCLSMTRQEIGSYLNLAPETISRLFTIFHRQNILRVHKKHIHIINLSLLINLCHFPTDNLFIENESLIRALCL